jgi:hypothetical protein
MLMSKFPEEPRWPWWKILSVAFAVVAAAVLLVRALAGFTMVKTVWAMIP